MNILNNKKRKAENTLNTLDNNNLNSQILEEFRTVRTNLHFSMVGKKYKSIVVTSSGQGEGKSFTAANLAVTIATENKKVLLVDADLRRPSVHRSFGLDNYLGLTTLLSDYDTPASKVIKYNPKNNIYILASGAIPPNPSELLGSERMNGIMEELAKEFDFIIYDLPPVLPVTDAQILASKVDGVIFVFSIGKVSEEEAYKSKELLDIVGAKVIGAIFNRVESKNSNYYYQADK